MNVRWVSLAVVAGLVGPALQAASDNQPEAIFSEDRRLDRGVGIHVEGLPVSELLGLLARRTGVSLSAVGEAADDKVIVFSSARPLRAQLLDLAALFGNRWLASPAAPGRLRYFLARRRATSEREAALLKKAEQSLLADLAQQVAALVDAPNRSPAPNEVIRNRLADPETRLATSLYAVLTDAQRAQLMAQKGLRVPFRTLAPQQQDSLRQAFAEHARATEQTDPELADRRAGNASDWTEELEQGAIRFTVHNDGGNLVVGVHVVTWESRRSLRTLEAQRRWLLPAHGDPYTGAPASDGAALPDGRLVRSAGEEREWIERLSALASRSGKPVLADYYRIAPRSGALPSGEGRSMPDTATSALDRFAEPDGSLWWVRDETLLFRRREWYVQRQYEVPDSWLLAAIQRLAARRYVPTYGDACRLNELTVPQFYGLNMLASSGTDEHELLGVRALLQIVESSPGTHIATPSSEMPDLRERLKQVSLRYRFMDPTQRRVFFPRFLEVVPEPPSREEVEQFRMFLSRWKDQPETSRTGYQCVEVGLTWHLGGEKQWLYRICLPASLPDDRRAKSRIELAE
jgi:hypothetical protein